MRSTTMAVVLALFTPACGSAANVAEMETVSATSTPRPSRVSPVGLAPVIEAPGAGGAGGSKGGTTGSGTYTGPGQSGCSFGVTGAAVAWVGQGWGWVWEPGLFQCEATTAGYSHGISAQIGPFHGPGQYVSAGPDHYTRSWCTQGTTDCVYEDFASAAQTCVFDLTVAPTDEKAGAPIAGTFSCGELDEKTDPTHAVTIYAGSLWAVLSPPPE